MEEKNICSTLRFREKMLMEGSMAKASGGATVTTTEVADFWFMRFRFRVKVTCRENGNSPGIADGLMKKGEELGIV